MLNKMNRTYSNKTDADADNTDVKFFTGKEVEKTPAFGKDTLFIVGLITSEEVVAELARINADANMHLFFGANHSYHPDTADEYVAWEDTIRFFLELGYWCSLDIPVADVEEFHEGDLCSYSTFIPQIRISLPYLSLWNYNTMVKIDDKGFNKTNPGVWCHRLHNLMDPDTFTGWDKYSGDTAV